LVFYGQNHHLRPEKNFVSRGDEVTPPSGNTVTPSIIFCIYGIFGLSANFAILKMFSKNSLDPYEAIAASNGSLQQI
jgi:hypothetical protein